MSDQLFIPPVSLGILLTLIFSWFVGKQTDAEKARRQATGALALHFAAMLVAAVAVAWTPGSRFSEAPWQWLVVDALNAIPLSLYAALSLGVVVLAPKRKLTPRWLAGIMVMCAMTCLAYAANNLLIFTLGWAGSLAPFLLTRAFAMNGVAADIKGPGVADAGGRRHTLPLPARIALWASLVSLCAGMALLVYAAPEAGLNEALGLTLARQGDAPPVFAAFAFLMGAVILRKGLFPAHSWLAPAFEQGPLLPMILLVNGHLGAFLVARIVLPLTPDMAHHAWSLLSNLSLFTAGYAALLALVARNPRRLLAMVSISQAAFLLTGLESNTQVGIAGSLTLWQVVAMSTTMLAAVYAAIEARLGGWPGQPGFLGLAAGAPRLAVFFAVGGLALVGAPLTLGFPAEDLLLQGTLVTNPYLGVVLPVVTALNAFSVMRMFARLFLGRPVAAAPGMADALPRERLALTAALLFLLAGGLFPAALIRLPAVAAARIIALMPGQQHSGR